MNKDRYLEVVSNVAVCPVPTPPPFMAVVWMEDDGSFGHRSFPAIAIRARSVRTYRSPTSSGLLEYGTHKELVDAGWVFCDERQDEQMLFIEEGGVLDEDGMRAARNVIGELLYADANLDEWKADAEKRLRRQMERIA